MLMEHMNELADRYAAPMAQVVETRMERCILTDSGNIDDAGPGWDDED